MSANLWPPQFTLIISQPRKQLSHQQSKNTSSQVSQHKAGRGAGSVCVFLTSNNDWTALILTGSLFYNIWAQRKMKKVSAQKWCTSPQKTKNQNPEKREGIDTRSAIAATFCTRWCCLSFRVFQWTVYYIIATVEQLYCAEIFPQTMPSQALPYPIPQFSRNCPIQN